MSEGISPETSRWAKGSASKQRRSSEPGKTPIRCFWVWAVLGTAGTPLLEKSYAAAFHFGNPEAAVGQDGEALEEEGRID